MKKNLIKFFLGVIVGILLTSATVYAAIEYDSYQVKYNNSNSGLNATNVHSAILELEKIVETVSAPTHNIKHFTLNRLEYDDSILSTYVYYFENGMTWYQFIASIYDVATYDQGFISYNDMGVYHTGGQNPFIRYSDNTIVKPNEVIVPGETYIMSEDLCCFEPETLITIDLEGNTKKIKDIEVGDTIVVENVTTKEKHLTTVLKDASEHPETYDMTEVTLENGTKLKFNSYHPIYTTEGYKSVTNYNNYPTLEEGDYAVDFKHKKNKIVKIHRYWTSKAEMTYNLLIKGINEFYLEEEYSYIANNTLVHTGIAEYDDEDEWREKNRYKCTQQKVYKDFDYDKATEQELIKYLVELRVSNEDAFNEYIKYYISADQYYRYAKVARIVKDKLNELSNINTLHYTTKNQKNQLKNNS